MCGYIENVDWFSEYLQRKEKIGKIKKKKKKKKCQWKQRKNFGDWPIFKGRSGEGKQTPFLYWPDTVHMLFFLIITKKGRVYKLFESGTPKFGRGARWLSGRVSDSGARGPGFETYRRRVVSLSKTLYSPKVLVNYPGSDGSVPTWLKNCWLGR